MKSSFLSAGSGAGLLALIAALSTAALPGNDAGAADEEAPETLELTGIVRDFKASNVTGGHPDFQKRPISGFGHYVGNIAPYMSSDGKPVFTGGGHKVTSQWMDPDHHEGPKPICYLLYDAEAGDEAGAVSASVDTGAIESATSFDKWFRDVPGVNMSMPLTLTLVRQSDGSYVFDDKTDPLYMQLGGFFPIEGQLFGNPGLSPDRNFHFTFELHTTFTHDAEANHYFKFIGDDDVWVFVNGQLVIDLGGVHSELEQFVEINRLGLTDDETYTLAFFFAERHTTQSNFRIATSLPLVSTKVPSVTAAYD
jgi:fibro-slime domain-containing protein